MNKCPVHFLLETIKKNARSVYALLKPTAATIQSLLDVFPGLFIIGMAVVFISLAPLCLHAMIEYVILGLVSTTRELIDPLWLITLVLVFPLPWFLTAFMVYVMLNMRTSTRSHKVARDWYER